MVQLNGHLIPVFIPMAAVPVDAEMLIPPDNPVFQIHYVINNTLQSSGEWYSPMFPVCCDANAPGGSVETCAHDGAGWYTSFGFNKVFTEVN